MRRWSILIAALFLTAIPTGAAAQSEWEDMPLRKRDELRFIQARFGDCVVKKRHEAARIFVLTPDFADTSDWRRAVDKVADGDCLIAATAAADGVRMTFPADTMRYALADGLVRREFPAASAPSVKDAAPLVLPSLDETAYLPKSGRKAKPAQLAELADRRGKRIGLIYLAAFGECIVRANPHSSHALILADPGSSAEKAAFAGLGPTLGECVSAGRSVKFDKAIVRGTIAMNFYRLAHAPKVSSTATGASR